ncbi:hypothetical protein [Chitinophaga sp.]
MWKNILEEMSLDSTFVLSNAVALGLPQILSSELSLLKSRRTVLYNQRKKNKKGIPKFTFMKRIAFAFATIGTVFAVLAQYAITNDWAWFRVFHTLGFIGYILIISAAAFFSLMFIHQLSRDEKVRMRNRSIDIDGSIDV